MRQVMDWLSAPAAAAKLERAFFRCDDPEVAAEVSQAVDRLGWARAGR
jgi:hypothetical protein